MLLNLHHMETALKTVPALALAIVFGCPMAAFAGPASDAVKYFYDHPGAETDRATRGRYTSPAADILNLADANATPDEVGCIDFALSLDAQDVDVAAVSRTLKLDEQITGEKAVVTARFKLFDDADANSLREIEWDLTKIGNDWKVSDIASKAGEWRLSTLDCTAEN